MSTGATPADIPIATTVGRTDKDDLLMSSRGVDSPTGQEVFLDDTGHAAQHPTEEESRTLRKVAGHIPTIAYWMCAIEFAERASFYAAKPLFNNFVNKPLPAHGNGWGSPADKKDTPGALGLGTSVSSAVSQSFSMLVYALPVLFGWLADAKTGRFSLVVWGVVVCGIAHTIQVAAGAPALLQAHRAVAPFMISVYVLAIGAAMFKPNISPILLDQMPLTKPVTKITKKGEKVIVDTDATTERVMLWFYLLINVGGFMGVPTSYLEKFVGWWPAFMVPLALYVPLLPLLWYLKKKLVLHPPGGSELGKVVRIVAISFKRGGWRKVFRKGFFEAAKPSVIAQSGSPMDVPWDDQFVDDVGRAFEATAIFAFFPIQYINDNGLGEAANVQSTMLYSNGVPNDLLGNFNSLIIIIAIPIVNYGLYPALRKARIHFGPVARITLGLFIATLGGMGYTILNYYGYKTGPCGEYSTSLTCVDEAGDQKTGTISVWWMAIPYAVGGLSEIFVNVPAYGIAYSRAPPNMRGLVSAINLFSTAIAYAIGLACSAVIADPYLTWVFAIPTIIGAVSTPVFYFLFRHIDKEEYHLSEHNEYLEDANIDSEKAGVRNSSVAETGGEKGGEKSGLHPTSAGPTGA